MTPNDEVAQFLANRMRLAVEQPAPDQPASSNRVDRIRERLSPLAPRLEEKLSRLPPEVRNDGLHLDEVQSMCIGRQRSKPTTAAVACALRELGWQSRRFYRENQPAVTLWFASGNPVLTTSTSTRCRVRARQIAP